MRLEILRRPLTHPDAGPIIERLDHELVTTEPDGGICFIQLDPADVEDGNGAFYIAYVDDAPAACGAFRRIDTATAEVKRMWVDPADGAACGSAPPSCAPWRTQHTPTATPS